MFEIDDILSKAYAETNPDESILKIIAQNRQKSYEDIKAEWNKAVMSPLKKLFSALRLSGFLAFAGAIALTSNHASRLEFYCGVYLVLSFVDSYVCLL